MSVKTMDQAASGTGEGPIADLNHVLGIPVTLNVVVGSAIMSIAQVLKLGRGSVVALDRKIGDPVELAVNGRVVARGQVVVLDDDASRLGVSLTEVVGSPDRASGNG